eukprot:gene49813-6311_t
MTAALTELAAGRDAAGSGTGVVARQTAEGYAAAATTLLRSACTAGGTAARPRAGERVLCRRPFGITAEAAVLGGSLDGREEDLRQGRGAAP